MAIANDANTLLCNPYPHISLNIIHAHQLLGHWLAVSFAMMSKRKYALLGR